MDQLTQFKERQKEGWAHFAPLETWTTPAASKLIAHARMRSGQRVLDVACGTGVVAVTASRLGARVVGLDLTPELIARARENAQLAEVDVEWHEGDAESLPFEDGAFDVVLSQFGHMFAPRPEVAVSEMLRVLEPGGTIAFTTWPPELLIGRVFALTARYMPPPPPGVAPPPLWGDPNVVRERLGAAVKDLAFDRATMYVATLSPQHLLSLMERTAGPLIKMVELLSATDPAKLEAFRQEYQALVADHLDGNTVRQQYLMTRATKV